MIKISYRIVFFTFSILLFFLAFFLIFQSKKIEIFDWIPIIIIIASGFLCTIVAIWTNINFSNEEEIKFAFGNNSVLISEIREIKKIRFLFWQQFALYKNNVNGFILIPPLVESSELNKKLLELLDKS